MSETCRTCASPRVLRDAQVLCYGFTGPSAVVVQGPVVSFWKGQTRSPVIANVCVDCGHVELRASGLAELQKLYATMHNPTPLGLET